MPVFASPGRPVQVGGAGQEENSAKSLGLGRCEAALRQASRTSRLLSPMAEMNCWTIGSKILLPN